MSYDLKGLVDLVYNSTASVSERSKKTLDDWDFHLKRLLSEYIPIIDRYESLAQILTRFSDKTKDKVSVSLMLEFNRLSGIISTHEIDLEQIREMTRLFGYVKDDEVEKCEKCNTIIIIENSKKHCIICGKEPDKTIIVKIRHDKDLQRALLNSHDSDEESLQEQKDHFELLWLANTLKIIDDAPITLETGVSIADVFSGFNKTSNEKTKKIGQLVQGGNSSESFDQE